MATDASRVFEEWAKAGRAHRMGASHATRGRAVLERLPVRAGQRCLDLGCGAGWATRELAKRCHPGGEAIGVDLSETMLALARAEGGEGARYLRASITELPLPDAHVDHVFSMEALYYVDVVTALHEAARVLRPGGHLAVAVDFYEENPSSHSWPSDLGLQMERLSADDWWHAVVGSGFTDVDMFYSREPGVDGSAGTLAVVGMRT
jgi:ubiquinone/menaquinone biosynthesis C-methylase UbiE